MADCLHTPVRKTGWKQSPADHDGRTGRPIAERDDCIGCLAATAAMPGSRVSGTRLAEHPVPGYGSTSCEVVGYFNQSIPILHVQYCAGERKHSHRSVPAALQP
ncbi:MAG: hypothetical protein K6A82_00975 [Prevotella sp.]|nr:hypothetical protein [Prevotella sp.]